MTSRSANMAVSFWIRSLACGLSLCVAAAACAQDRTAADASDWHQFLGPQRDGVCRSAVKLLERWPAGGPKEVWRTGGGVGMSGIAVSGQQFCTLIQNEGKQWLVALDAS